MMVGERSISGPMILALVANAAVCALLAHGVCRDMPLQAQHQQRLETCERAWFHRLALDQEEARFLSARRSLYELYGRIATAMVALDDARDEDERVTQATALKALWVQQIETEEWVETLRVAAERATTERINDGVRDAVTAECIAHPLARCCT